MIALRNPYSRRHEAAFPPPPGPTRHPHQPGVLSIRRISSARSRLCGVLQMRQTNISLPIYQCHIVRHRRIRPSTRTPYAVVTGVFSNVPHSQLGRLEMKGLEPFTKSLAWLRPGLTALSAFREL